MSHEITLPSGATAIIKDPDDITFGEREDVIGQFDIDLETGQPKGSGGTLMNQLQRALLTVGVASWTVADKATGQILPLPAADPNVVRQLSSKDGAYLVARVMPLARELLPDFSVDGSVTQDPATGMLVNDKNSPTSPSAGSVTG